jgi:hypothetical protein
VLVRNAVVTALVAIATAGSLIALTPTPWTVALPSAVLLGTSALLVDLVFYGRPLPRATPGGRRLIVGFASLAALAALTLAFALGYSIRKEPPAPYPYIAIGGGVTAQIFGLPVRTAPVLRYVALADEVLVRCQVSGSDGTWFKLAKDAGWVSGDDFMAAPHTGRGQPPSCP